MTGKDNKISEKIPGPSAAALGFLIGKTSLPLIAKESFASADAAVRFSFHPLEASGPCPSGCFFMRWISTPLCMTAQSEKRCFFNAPAPSGVQSAGALPCTENGEGPGRLPAFCPRRFVRARKAAPGYYVYNRSGQPFRAPNSSSVYRISAPPYAKGFSVG